eukprot:3210336-Prymnesium_polylepis.2
MTPVASFQVERADCGIVPAAGAMDCCAARSAFCCERASKRPVVIFGADCALFDPCDGTLTLLASATLVRPRVGLVEADVARDRFRGGGRALVADGAAN